MQCFYGGKNQTLKFIFKDLIQQNHITCMLLNEVSMCVPAKAACTKLIDIIQTLYY